MTRNSIVGIGFIVAIFAIGVTAFFAFPNKPDEQIEMMKRSSATTPIAIESVAATSSVLDREPAEADPFPRNTDWTWLRTTAPGGRVAQPRAGKSFVISFDAAGGFTVKGDCNSISGQYIVWGPGDVSMENIISTQMYCEDSQEADFIDTLYRTTAYKVHGNTLSLDIEGDIAGYGLMTFTKVYKRN